jgi:wobble nucleotide-excising tRNase
VIKNIKKIKGLGVFGDYAQPAGTSEFGVKNIIYGWNYSGKTTLSRLVAMIEHKKTNPELPDCLFSIETDTGTITEANFEASQIVARVFNSDFIADNLNFAGSSFKPILLLGAESDAAQKEIEQHEIQLSLVRAHAETKSKESVAAKKALDKAKTDAAAAIKSNISLVSAFGSTQLDKELSIVGMALADYDLKDGLEGDLKIARTSQQDLLPSLPTVSITLSLETLRDAASILLGKTPDLANTIEHLTQNPDIESWIGAGLPLHAEKDMCEFCGGPLHADRLVAFKAHFSKDLSNHKQQIQSLLTKMNAAKIAYAAPRDFEVNVSFRAQLKIDAAALQDSIDAYNSAVDELRSQLTQKHAAPFTTITLDPLDSKISKAVTDAIESIGNTIDANNSAKSDFPKQKQDAVARLKLHFAQEFANREKLDEQEARQKRFTRHAKKYQALNDALQSKIQELKALISQAQLGREEINKRIEGLLGANSVQIAVVKHGAEERFQLVRRDGKPAKHLSEGEKTAIAFSFFLTKLREIKDFSQVIVYIDDPISSLDSNHIFQVTAIIKEAFFHQEVANGPWKTRCKQIFFSTHNFEFFSLLRELNPKKSGAARHYMVKRLSPKTSTFGDMPESLYRYSSEYHFLFSILNDFNQAADKTDLKVLMLLPNAVRRFIELYTYAKYPDTHSAAVDSRAERIFGPEKAKRILKVLHYFSHANNIEQLSGNNDHICDIEAAVGDLMVTLKETDPMHLEALEAAIAA